MNPNSSQDNWFDQTSIDMKQKIMNLLQKTFKIQDFRGIQEQAVRCGLTENDFFVILRSGGGKSLTYQLPGLLLNGVTVVIGPLISLINDQMNSLQEKGIKSIYIIGEMSQLESQIKQEKIKFVFITPEKLFQSTECLDFFQSMYTQKLITRFIIDEAHCLSTWGPQFRPNYNQLFKLRELFPLIPFTLLTASATQKVIDDIIARLQLRKPIIFRASFNRPNLFYSVLNKNQYDPLQTIKEFCLEKYKGKSGIIYCPTKQMCEKLAQELFSKYSIICDYYHAGLPQVQRETVFNQWKNNQIQVVIATIALGMGIDKGDVRFVIHEGFTDSPENYYQETGRAGRDGLDSECVLFYKKQDLSNKFWKEINMNDHQQQINNSYGIRQMMDYCENQADCRRKQILSYFGENFDEKDCNEKCDNCLKKKNSLFEFKRNTENIFNEVVDFVQKLQNFLRDDKFNYITFLQLKGVVAGQMKISSESIKNSLLANGLFGIFKTWNFNKIEQLLSQLIKDQILFETTKQFSFSKYNKGCMQVQVNQTNFLKLKQKNNYFLTSVEQSLKNDQKTIIKKTPQEIYQEQEIVKQINLYFQDLFENKKIIFDPANQEVKQFIDMKVKNFKQINQIQLLNDSKLIQEFIMQEFEKLKSHQDLKDFLSQKQKTNQNLDNNNHIPLSLLKKFENQTVLLSKKDIKKIKNVQQQQQQQTQKNNDIQVKLEIDHQNNSENEESDQNDEDLDDVFEIIKSSQKEMIYSTSNQNNFNENNISGLEKALTFGEIQRNLLNEQKLIEKEFWKSQEEEKQKQKDLILMQQPYFEEIQQKKQEKILQTQRENYLENKKIFDENFGYLTEQQYSQVLEKLKKKRKEIQNKLNEDQNQIIGIEDVVPLNFLKNLAKYQVKSENQFKMQQKQLFEDFLKQSKFIQYQEEFFEIINEFCHADEEIIKKDNENLQEHKQKQENEIEENIQSTPKQSSKKRPYPNDFDQDVIRQIIYKQIKRSQY